MISVYNNYFILIIVLLCVYFTEILETSSAGMFSMDQSAMMGSNGLGSMVAPGAGGIKEYIPLTVDECLRKVEDISRLH